MNKPMRVMAGVLLTMLLTLLPMSVLAQARYAGRVVQTFPNCGLTQVVGEVHDEAGNPLTGVKVRLWWGAANASTLYATSGAWDRDITDSSGWEFTLNVFPVANSWLVAIEDANGNLISDPVAVQTTSECEGSGAANTVKVDFRRGGVSVPVPNPNPAPAPVPAPSGGAEMAPPLTAGATCQTFTQTGYTVCDDANARFLSAFRRYSLQSVGYPISSRFKRDGFITQAFQKAIFQWRSESNSVAMVNVFDELHNRGYDTQLFQARQTPNPLPEGWDGSASFNEVVLRRQALLNVRPALRATYFAASDPLLFFGLPTSEVMDMGNHYAIRLQRGVLQEWKETVPWARAGQVTIANGGDIAKELGHLPAFAVGAVLPSAPVPSPASGPQPTATPVPAPSSGSGPRNLDPRLGALGVGIAPASVAPGQPYWRVVEVIWHDESQAGGRHSILVDVMDEAGNRVVGQPVKFSWASGNVILPAEAKPFPEYATNFPMYAHSQAYNVNIEGLPSEAVTGMGLGDLTSRNFNIHVEYLIKFQRAIR